MVCTIGANCSHYSTSSNNVSLIMNFNVDFNCPNYYNDGMGELLNTYHYVKTTKTKKIRYASARIIYYNNSSASFNLVLSGDIERNPGPSTDDNKRKTAPICQICSKTVRSNNKRLLCSHCYNFIHLKCTTDYKIAVVNCRQPVTWTCCECLHRELPMLNASFASSQDSFVHIDIDTSTVNSHLQLLDEHRNHTSIAHLNTHSMCSTFDEFSVMLNMYQFNIISLSETWLKDNKYLLDYVNIPGCNFEYRNRDNRWCWFLLTRRCVLQSTKRYCPYG